MQLSLEVAAQIGGFEYRAPPSINKIDDIGVSVSVVPPTPSTESCSSPTAQKYPVNNAAQQLNPHALAETLSGLSFSDQVQREGGPQTIEEEDFGDYAGGGTNGQAEADSPASRAVIGAMRGKGLPGTEEIAASQSSKPEGSVVTDLGYRLAWRAQRGPLIDSEDTTPGPLLERLNAAKVNWDSSNPDAAFIPKRKLIQIVSKDAVKEDLGWRSLLQHGHLPRRDLASEAERICGSGEPSFPVGQHLGWNKEPESPIHPLSHDTLGSPQKSYRKIMAILVLIQKPSQIRRFLKEDISDADLPLEKKHVVNSPLGSLRWELRSHKADSNKMIRCFKGWRHSALSDFERRQWTVLSPFFAPGGVRQIKIGRYSRNVRMIYHYRLHDRVVLPFTKQEKVRPPGGCGQVMKVEIHPDHHVFNLGPTSRPNVFAVKQLTSKREDFIREVSMLKRLNSDPPHPHLVVLLATYEHRNSFHLIFPWAEADLLGYWERINSVPARDPRTSQWLATQCKGLAQALGIIHRFSTSSNDSLLLDPDHNDSARQAGPTDNSPLSGTVTQDETGAKVLFGLHGDIKPPNILWFPGSPEDVKAKHGSGLLKITDFGTSEFTRDNTTSRRHIGNSYLYRAPEVDTPGAVVGPPYDIWALGCVYLEFVAWYFEGWTGVRSFGRKRSTLDIHPDYSGIKTPTFFTIDKGRPVVKKEVDEYINGLRNDPKVPCSQFFHDFLQLIQEYVLVADMTQGNRMAALNIVGRLHVMLDRGDDYWTMPEPAG